MKKLVTLLFVMAMIFTITACGSTETQKQPTYGCTQAELSVRSEVSLRSIFP